MLCDPFDGRVANLAALPELTSMRTRKTLTNFTLSERLTDLKTAFITHTDELTTIPPTNYIYYLNLLVLSESTDKQLGCILPPTNKSTLLRVQFLAPNFVAPLFQRVGSLIYHAFYSLLLTCF